MSREPKDPFAELTRHRAIPRPGAGRTQAPSQAATRTTATQRGPVQPASPLEPEEPSASIDVKFGDFVGTRANALLAIAMPLLALIGQLRTSVQQPNVQQARLQAIKAVRDFNTKVADCSYPQDVRQRASYVLCTAIDQSVLSTPWGMHSEWPSQGLLVTFHQEAWGGTRFFEILDYASSDAPRYIDLLELLYVCLSLGFAGRYQEDPHGPARLLELRDDSYRRIRDVRGVPPERLADKWEGERDRRNRLVRYVPLWVIAAVAAAAVLGCFLFYAFLLHSNAQPLHDELNGIAMSRPDYTHVVAPVSHQALTLKELLSPEEAVKVLTVEETDKGALVSLIATDLFGSGSATLNPRHSGSIRKVAEALNQVRGRIVVIGHTDDQPIRSLHFADNMELSRARATAVKQLLNTYLREPGRVSWMGLGSSAPKFTPANLPQNRAGNRRVEILLQNN